MAEEAETKQVKKPKRIIMQTGKGIPKVKGKEDDKVKRNPDQTLMRPDDLMREDFQEAVQKETAELSDNEIVAVEREIRRYVSILGGFRQGLGDGSITKCNRMLKKLGRSTKEPQWDRSIIVPGFEKY